MEEDLNQYIDEFVDEYVSFEDKLAEYNISFENALKLAKDYKNNFFDLLKKYDIKSEDDFVNYIENNSVNDDVINILASVITDNGLLFDEDERDDEQDILCYFEQKKNCDKVIENIKEYLDKKQRLNDVLKNLNTQKIIKAIDKDEINNLYDVFTEYVFLVSKVEDKSVLGENIIGILNVISQNDNLEELKPYIIWAIATRKHTMLTKRKGYNPNLSALFKYQDYSIENDNTKNFNMYQEYLELYDELHRMYEDEIDMSLSDFCMAELCNLSDWYYLNCVPNDNIPKPLSIIIKENSTNFSQLKFSNLSDINFIKKISRFL